MNPFIGQLLMFAGNFAPRGWYFCEGQLLAISQNDALFSILGTTYGGDGRTTFALPDLRGRAPIHKGTGPGLSSRSLGAKLGGENNTLTVGQLPSHSHSLNGSSNDADQASSANGFLPSAGRGGENRYASAAGTAQGMGPAIGNVGNNSQLNNMQPSLVINYIICAQGVYPSRS